MVRVFGATEGGDVTLLHIGLRGQRLPRGQRDFQREARGHYGAGRANVSVQKSDAGCLYSSVDLQGMHGSVSLAHETLSEQSRVKLVL